MEALSAGNIENIKRFLATGRTLEEIKDNLKVNDEKSLRAIAKEMPDCDLFVHRTNNGQLLFILAKKPVGKQEIKQKIWTYRLQPDGEPFMWVQFPDNVSWDRIVIPLIADIHYGSVNCDERLFKRAIRQVATRENVFPLLIGDATENVIGDFPPGAIFEQKMRPRDQLSSFEEIIRPVAHKFIAGIPGNHEMRSKNRCDLDPMFFICRELDIPYFDEPMYINILWKSFVFSIFVQHGHTNAQTEGGKINKAILPSKFYDFTMFIVMGHIHDKGVNKIMQICRERSFNEEGELEGVDLVGKKQYIVTCPGFLKYHGSYAARMVFVPTSMKKVSLTIYANGDYHVPG